MRVTDAANLDSTLRVTGGANFSTVDSSSNTTAANFVTTGLTHTNGLRATGAANLASTLRVTSAANLDSTLRVTSAANLDSTLRVTGGANFSTVDSSSNTTAANFVTTGLTHTNGLRVTGAANFATVDSSSNTTAANFVTTGLTHSAALRTSGRADIGGALTATSGDIGSNFGIGGTLTVAGDFVISGDILYDTDAFTLSVVTPVTNTGAGYFGVYRGNNSTVRLGSNSLANSDANAYIRWEATSNTWQIRDVFNPQTSSMFSKILTANLISDSISSTITSNIASSLAVKTAYDTATFAGTYANSAYLSQNITGLYANSAFTAANTADQRAVTSGSYANSAFQAANSAGSYANSAYLSQNTTGIFANGAYQFANSAGSYANSAYALANTVNTNDTAARSYANGAFQAANSAGSYANSAYTLANTKFSSSGGTVSGSVVVTGDLTVSGTTTYVNTTELKIGDAIITLNADLPQSSSPTENAGIEVERGTLDNAAVIWNETTDRWTFTNDGTVYSNIGSAAAESYSNSAFQAANSAGSYANSAYAAANTKVSSVSGTAPVVSSGGTTPAISMAAATSSVNGYMTSTYASKLDGIAAGATNVTNNNQLTNGAGYITGYTEVDTLATVTGRGATTSTASIFNGGITVKDSMSASTTIAGGNFNLFSNLTGFQSLTIAGGNLTTGTDKYVYVGTGTNHASSTTTVEVGSSTSGSLTKIWSPLTVVGTIGASNFSGSHSGTSSGTNTGDNAGVTSVTGTAPVVSSGGNTPAISMAAATSAVNGYMTSTYASKLDGIDSSAINSVTIATTAPITGGTTGRSFTLAIPAATSAANGYMTSTYANKLDGIAAGATNVTNNNQLTNGNGFISSVAITTTGPLTGGGTASSFTLAIPAATSAANGYMTSTYASKLDGIASGATNVTNTNQLTNGAGYITGITSGNVTTALGYTPYNSTNPSGYTTNTGTVTSVGTGNGLTGGSITTTGTLSMSGSYTGTFAITGALTATGDVTAFYSDQRLKKNITPIVDALSKVNTLRGVLYQGNEIAESYGYTDTKIKVGVIAQDLEKVLPQVVVPAPFDTDKEGNSISGENYKTVQYEKIVPLLIEAIKELTAKVSELESKINK